MYKLEYREEAINNTEETVEVLEESSVRKRRSGVIWFNPPFSMNVKTNIGKRFITIMKKHFPPKSELYKIFNQKKVKMSYSCLPNMQNIISAHNSKVTRDMEKEDQAGCNCRGGVVSCPLEGKCQTQSLVYQAKVSSTEGDRFYLGQAASTFKLRWNNHRDSFRNTKKEHSTALSIYVWSLIRKDVYFTV